MLKITLHVLSQILEVATLPDIGKHADEFLSYLRTTVSLEPTDSVLCVQQVKTGGGVGGWEAHLI